MREDEVPRYNITVHTGSDYQLDLAIIADDDMEISDYGVLIYEGVLRDGTGSEMDTDNELLLCSDGWSISDEVMEYSGSGEIIVGNWQLEAQLREYEEAQDHFDFDISVTTAGYQLILSHDITEKIPYTYGKYDVFVINADTGVKSKLLHGDAKIIRRATR